MDEKYKDAYGVWDVTTEGDCEGRTVENLGTYVGYLDEIALHLAKKCCYSLKFKKVERDKRFLKTKNRVNVMLDIESKTWDMSSKERAEYMRKVFESRPVRILEGMYYASFEIESNSKERGKGE